MAVTVPSSVSGRYKRARLHRLLAELGSEEGTHRLGIESGLFTKVGTEYCANTLESCH